jgi:hypothetical protein
MKLKVIKKKKPIRIFFDGEELIADSFWTFHTWKEYNLKLKGFGLEKKVIKFIYNQDTCTVLRTA